MKVKKMLCGTLACTMLVSQAPVANSNWGYVSVVEAATAKVGVSKGKVSVKQGGSTSVKMVGLGKSDKVKWSASNKNVTLKVSKDTQSVTVTGKKVGSVTLVATVGKKQYTSKVTVTSAVGLSVTSKTLTKGQSFNLTLTGGGSSAVWKASNKNITIKKVGSNKYKVTAKKAGSAYIDVSLNGKKYRCKVTVKNPVAISKSKVSIKYGKTYTLSLKNATGKISWTVKKGSSNVTLRVAKNGKCTVVPKRVGSAIVQASNGGKKYTCKVTVKAVSKPKLTKSTITVDAGKTATIKLSGVKYATKTTYTSSDTKVATVTKKGVIKGVKTGTAKITVYADGVKLVQNVIVKGDGENPVTPGETIPDETEKPSTPSKPTETEKPAQTEGSKQTEAPRQTEGTTPSTNPSTPGKPEESETNGGGGGFIEDITEVPDPSEDENETDPGKEDDNPPGGGNEDEDPPVDLSKYDVSKCPSKWSLAGGMAYDFYVKSQEDMADVTFKLTTGNAYINNGAYYSTLPNGTPIKGVAVYGVKKGTDTLKIYVGDELLKSCDIIITSTDTNRLDYLDWLADIEEKCGFSDSTKSAYAKMEAFANYILANYDYNVSAQKTYYKDKCGNCDESTRVLIDAARDLGLQAEVHNAPDMGSEGHINAKIIIDGMIYYFEAGYTGSAPRGEVTIYF